VILGAGGAMGFAVRDEDWDLTRRAAASHTLDEAFDPGAVAGSGIAQFGLAFWTYALGRVQHSPLVSRLGADLVRAQLVNTVLTQGIKFAVQRERPDGGKYSFPSGHTSGAFATATVLQRHLGWKVGVPAYAVATYVAGNRLPENKHFLSDVLFGAAVGIASGRTVTIGQGRARFALSPLTAPGGGGIGLTLVDAP
jgi:membrane-associated phospholipid phosphatase